MTFLRRVVTALISGWVISSFLTIYVTCNEAYRTVSTEVKLWNTFCVEIEEILEEEIMRLMIDFQRMSTNVWWYLTNVAVDTRQIISSLAACGGKIEFVYISFKYFLITCNNNL